MSISGVGSMSSAHPLFGHIIAGSYKKGAAHPSESDMYVVIFATGVFLLEEV